MNIWQSPDTFHSPVRTAVSVGNFDGVHSGHAALVREVAVAARRAGLSSAIITFDPHTRSALAPSNPQPVLSTFEEKAVLLEPFGIDHVIRIDFSERVRTMSSAHFVEQILARRLHVARWVMGEGHMFGADRLGSGESLHQLLSRNDICGLPLPLLTDTGEVVSSTGIRGCVASGDMTRAVAMLGHPYLIAVRRVTGLGLGTKLGYPTLNFKRPHPDKVLPPAGVYAARLQAGSSVLPGALYFGTCPTLAPREAHFEMHLLEMPPADVEEAREGLLWVHRFVREDRVFDDESGLIRQIHSDIETIQNFFREGD